MQLFPVDFIMFFVISFLFFECDHFDVSFGIWFYEQNGRKPFTLLEEMK